MTETAREDELLAMENIFGREEFRRSETSPGGVMKVCPQLPLDFKVVGEGERNRQYDLQFLPPLVVDFELPQAYPSHSSPAFRMSCQWLRHSQLAEVCRHLDEMWQSTGGEVVLFPWFQFLREDLLGFLSICSPWVINCVQKPEQGALPQGSDTTDPRVTTAFNSDTDLLQWLLDHNQKMQQKLFERQAFECGICFLAKSGLECHRFKGCEHIFCKDCITNLFRIGIEEGRVLRFSCPDTGCDSVATSSEVKELIGAELFGQYDQLLLQKSLDCMADVVYCPRSNCSSPVILEPRESFAFCASCVFAFCTKCSKGYHGVSTCPKDAEGNSDLSASGTEYAPLPKTLEGKQKLWEDYEQGSRLRKRLLQERYGKTFNNNMADFLSGGWIQTNTQECPKCCVKIQKAEGCNFMHCAVCLSNFCWACCEILPKRDPFAHFRGGCSL